MVVNILATIAQWERETISERTMVALRHKRAMGQHVGRVPFGYRLTGDGRLEVTFFGHSSTLALLARGLDLGGRIRLSGRTVLMRSCRPGPPTLVAVALDLRAAAGAHAASDAEFDPLPPS